MSEPVLENELNHEESPIEDSAVPMADESAGEEFADDGDDNEIVGQLEAAAEVKTKSPETETPKAEPKPRKRDWYILKVQVNREDTIKKNLERRIAVSGLKDLFGDILVPTEKVTEIRGDKKRIVKRKLYPGYIMVFMEINDDTWFLVRETSGVGDFTGTQGRPTPMMPHEVQRILKSEEESPQKAPELKVGYQVGQTVKVKDGPFETLEGTVDNIDGSSGRVTVIINIFGRSTPVELEYWQVELTK
ncbi:MAG: transcription termination/antitermination protein NusG [Planctomycetaceae bacterium]|jgi:transcriptional antiterminator NusG|nr:transcription termination/antitermination protein NusG [Planctomycetaceae bacterium]